MVRLYEFASGEGAGRYAALAQKGTAAQLGITASATDVDPGAHCIQLREPLQAVLEDRLVDV